jgi:hypothetical protein
MLPVVGKSSTVAAISTPNAHWGAKQTLRERS